MLDIVNLQHQPNRLYQVRRDVPRLIPEELLKLVRSNTYLQGFPNPVQKQCPSLLISSFVQDLAIATSMH